MSTPKTQPGDFEGQIACDEQIDVLRNTLRDRAKKLGIDQPEARFSVEFNRAHGLPGKGRIIYEPRPADPAASDDDDRLLWLQDGIQRPEPLKDQALRVEVYHAAAVASGIREHDHPVSWPTTNVADLWQWSRNEDGSTHKDPESPAQASQSFGGVSGGPEHAEPAEGDQSDDA
jgi:hypothetical protein